LDKKVPELWNLLYLFENCTKMYKKKEKVVNHELVMIIYNELMQNSINQNLVKYLTPQYYYDTINQVLLKYYGKAYKPEVIRKIIRIELKRKSGDITLKIISMYKKWDGIEPPNDLINRIRQQVPCPKEYIHHVIESI